MLMQLRLLVLLWATTAATRILIPGPGLVPFQDAASGFSTQTVASTSEQECIASSLRNLSRVCQAGNGEGNSTLGDQLTRLLRSCMHGNSVSDAQHQPARILLYNASILTVVRNATKVYTDLTGTPITLDAPSAVIMPQVRKDSLAHAADPERTHEAWLINSGQVTSGITAGALTDMSNLVELDDRLQWEDIFRPVRESALLYKSKVVTLPLSTYSGLLFYRRDIFEQYNIPVPRTWRQLADTVQKYNGTEGLHGFCGGWGPCTVLGAALIKYMLATVHQTEGPADGWFMDPASLLNTSSPRYKDYGLLVNSPAAVEMAEIIRVLYQWSPPDTSASTNCQQDGSGFLQMNCLMTINLATVYKYVSYTGHGHPLQGKLGIDVIPGSDRVLDRRTNTLVPCDATRCPYATRYNTSDGGSMLVNRSPGFDALLLATNAHAPPELAFFTFRVVAFLASPQVDDLMMFLPDSYVFPTRYSQLDPQRWADAGFNYLDSQHWCDAHLAALSHENLHITVRLPIDIIGFLYGLSSNITNTTQAIPEVMAYAEQAAKQLLYNQYQGDMQALAADYYAGLNRQLPTEIASDAASANAQYAAASSDERSNALHTGLMAMAIALALLASVAFLFGLWRFRRSLLKQAGGVHHPVPGPLTTLLITDIERSTQLWEELPDGVMNAAMVLHDGCIRSLAADSGGYESMWEGDSFTIAFHTPQSALEFALLLQVKLLQLPWPPALLANQLTKEIWVKHSPHHATSKLMTAPSALQQLTLSLVASGRYNSESESPNTQKLVKTDSLPHGEASKQLADANSAALAPAGDSGGSFGARQQQLPRPTGDCALKAAPSYTSTSSSSFSQAAVPPPTPTSCDQSLASGPAARISSDSTARQTFSSLASTWSTYEQKVAGSWVCCDATAPGAQLIFRGLRVRVGLTLGAGVVSYHDAVGRYRYTGPIRMMANAVANAAHGGQIILNNHTAEALTSLPPHCTTLYMGAHLLPDVGPDPTHMVMALPGQLKARLANSSTILRTNMCFLPGTLRAPLPSSSMRPGLAYLQPSGLGILMAWDAPTTLQALTQLHQAVQQQAHRWDGFVFEDGLLWWLGGSGNVGSNSSTVAANLPDSPKASTSFATGATTVHCNCTSGSSIAHTSIAGKNASFATGGMAVAFPDPLRALKFAVCLRLDLLQLDWPQQLLSHELCEPLGWEMQPSPATSTQEIEVAAADTHPSMFPPAGHSTTTFSKHPGSDAALDLGVARIQVSAISLKSRGVAGTWYALDAPMLRGLRTRTVLLGKVQDMQPNLQTRGFMRATYTSKYSKQLGQLFKLARQGQVLADADVVAAAGWAMPAIPE